VDQTLINLLNGLSAGLLLFMLSSGLTLIFSMMGVLNFAHASFYMLGAYLGCTLAGELGFWPALLLAPVLVGVLGALFERGCLRRVHRHGHVAELLVTFGLSYVVLELVQLAWGRSALPFEPPPALQGAAFTLVDAPAGGLRLVLGAGPPGLCQDGAGSGVSCARFPLSRAFMMTVALGMLMLLWLLLSRTRVGLVVQAALTHPDMVEALGHNLPRILTLVFASGCALAALAGVIGGMTFVTEPAMAGVMGSILFVVVVVGGLGSLSGALLGSLLVGLLQTLPLSVDLSLAVLLQGLGMPVVPGSAAWPLLRITLAQAAPVLPYLLLVVVLVLRPRGLLGNREGEHAG
jgi:branched-chain amino acid transport system permease protein